jgi:predicted cupin superfamily sugar epimerase
MAALPADFWIKHLQLTRHIEGGWYAEVYRSELSFTQKQLPDYFTGPRSSCTHINFLLEKNQFSAFHRIRSDELWHFYQGDPLTVYEIDTDGLLHQHVLGNDPSSGQSLFCCIKAGNWFASKVNDGSEYSLAGCTVSPGFDFADFEMGNRNELLKKFPQHSVIINLLSLKM